MGRTGTNFQKGISVAGIPVLPGAGDIPFTGGKYFYVNSLTGVNAPDYGSSIDKPFATITYALTYCTGTSSTYPKQDVIIVGQGHTLTISAAGGLTIDKAGVYIIGLGNGSLRPTITWSATASTLAITAANVTMSNFITTISIDEVVSMINVTGAGCTLDRIDFQPYGAIGVTGQALQWLTTGTAAHYITIQNCKHYQYTAANTAQVWINLHTLTCPRVLNNFATIVGMASTSSHWIGTGGACVQVEIANNRIYFGGETTTGVITCTAGTTGMIYGNFLASGTSVAITTAIVASTTYVFENYWIDDPTASAILTPAAGTD